MSNQTPSLTHAIRGAIEAAMRLVFVALPARIESYDPTTRSCTAQPLILREFADEFAARNVERLPVCHAPVVFPGGQRGGYTYPVAVGDTVILLFSSQSLDRWLALGGEVDPKDPRHHNPSDAIAIPGLWDYVHVPAADPDGSVITSDDLRLGDANSTDDNLVAQRRTCTEFMTVLGTVADTAGACAALHAALVAAGWPNAFVAGKVRAS